MPNPTTLRDVVPILEDLRQYIKAPQLTKKDTVFYKRIAEATSLLISLDIENIVIESHAAGEPGKVLADRARNTCAEIVARIQTFWEIFSTLDREREKKAKIDLIDRYEHEHFLKEVEMLYMYAAHYEYALKACRRIPVPDGWTIDQYKQEIEMFHMAETREEWLDMKKSFLKKLQESIEYDEFLSKPSFKVYSELRGVCRRIFITTERYFPPCGIELNSRLRDAFIQKLQVANGSYLTPELIQKQPDSKTNQPRVWNVDLFPMVLISELHEVCDDVFEEATETQFHSSLNLHGKHEPLKIKSKQKIKVCYLISKLYEIVPEKHKTAWREDILQHFDIAPDYYDSKYSHPNGSDASQSSKEFAKEVDDIFKKHRKRA